MADELPLDAASVKRLIALLSGDDPAGRREAAERLAAADDPLAFAALKRAVNDADMTVRYMVRRSLKAVMERTGQTHSDPAVESDLSRKLEAGADAHVAEIARLLADPDAKKRMSALKLISVKRLREALPPLLSRIEVEKDHFVIATMVKVIGLIGDGSVLPVLSRFLGSDDPRVRANTVEGISYVHDNSKVALLEPLVRDADNRIRANALMALFPIKEPFVVAELTAMLDSGNDAVRDSAVYVIERLEKSGRTALRDRFPGLFAAPPAPAAAGAPATPAEEPARIPVDQYLRDIKQILLAVPRVDVAPRPDPPAAGPTRQPAG